LFRPREEAIYATGQYPARRYSTARKRKKAWRSTACCFSFNSAGNRAAFLADEDGYCRKFGLNDEQRAAVTSRSVLKMIEAGGNVYYLAKLAGIFGLNVQDIGAQQTGMTAKRSSRNFKQRGHDNGGSCWRHRQHARSGDRQSDCGKKQNDPYWRPFLKGFDFVHYWLARAKPDVAVVFYNDHGLNFFPRQTTDLCGRRRRRISQ